MCVFISAEEPTDILWVNKIVLVTPDGLDADPETQVIINGLIRYKKDCNEVTLNCVHVGEIYALKDSSIEWSNVGKELNGDWLSDRILNNRELNPIPRIKRHNNEELFFNFGNDKRFIAKIPSHKQSSLSDVEVYCNNGYRKHLIAKMPDKACFDEHIPIYSAFKLFLNKSESDFQLVRISFRTKANVHPYHSQINVNIEGPAAMLNSIKRNIDNKVTKQDRINQLHKQIENLPEFETESDLEIAIVSHPTTSLTIECAENTGTKFAVEFPLETTGTPIKSAACEGRVAFFDRNKGDAIIKAIATPVAEHRRQHSAEFLGILEDLRKELRKTGKAKVRSKSIRT